jgi:hypothetical protein
MNIENSRIFTLIFANILLFDEYSWLAVIRQMLEIFMNNVLNDHVRNVLNVSFGRSQNCLFIEAYIYS